MTEAFSKELSELLFPNITKTPDYYESIYPPRALPQGAQVTRLAPSPTGFIHLGNLFGALADERIAHRSGGVFYLRIEDTDKKREVDGAVEAVLENLGYFGLHFDEGAELDGDKTYAPYYQRQRAEIYQSYVKELVARNAAYPCFCTEEELNAAREKQVESNVNRGYYGEYAHCRTLSDDEIKEKLAAGLPYVIRLRALGDGERKFTFNDAIKGEISVLENDQDVVLLKQDGIPTYHFAHAIDDHLMRTTLVVRGEEWLASLPIHLQLFEILGFEAPRYAHTAQLMKLDDGKKRKLSKRLDPELSLSYYKAKGYMPTAVKAYLLTLLNSNFEEWFLANPEAPLDDFPFSIEKMGQSGALFDTVKLDDVCKTVVSHMQPKDVASLVLEWCREYSPENAAIIADEDKLLKIIELGMGVNEKKRRRDFVNAEQIFGLIGYNYPELFVPADITEYREGSGELLAQYADIFDYNGTAEEWFGKIKELAAANGYAVKMGDYKKNPDAYRGSVGDVAEAVRLAITGRKNTPDLYTIIHILGEDETVRRIKAARELLK